MTSPSSATDVNPISTPSRQAFEMRPLRRRRRVKKQKKEDDGFKSIPGVMIIGLSNLSQKIIGCVIDEDITTEDPWKHVPKEAITDNLALHKRSSEFLPVRPEIRKYPGKQVFMGYIGPKDKDSDLFYICVTEAAEKEISTILAETRRQQEEYAYNSIYKIIRSWMSYGSEREIRDMQMASNRPLIEVELESVYPAMATKTRFRFRFVQDKEDGYVELLSKRIVYNSLYVRQIHCSTQVTPYVVTNSAQTVCTYPQNMWTQYEFDSELKKELGTVFSKNFESFVDQKLNMLNDMLYVGGSINFYTSDYTDLVWNVKYSTVPTIGYIKQYTFLFEESLCEGKQIASLSWHPMWTGILATAYTDTSPFVNRKHKPNKDVVIEAIYGVTPVLLWSFKDTLKPRLHLLTPREVSVVSFCPYDENIVIGGCVNGQVIIWDISNKLEGVEIEEPLTVAQQKYRKRMHSLMSWMKNVHDPKLVAVTAISDLQHSHNDVIHSIKWLSPFREISKSGKIREIHDDENRTSLQFVTASKDGTILAWDLLTTPTTLIGGSYKPPRRSRRLKERPPALLKDTSPYKCLNRIFRPLFRIRIVEPNTSRPLPIATLSFQRTQPVYVEKDPNPNRKFDFAERVYYKHVFGRPTHIFENKINIGTREGHFITAGWDGFDFNAGAVVNQEVAKTESYARYHDGPIVSLSRSYKFPDLMLTVGGKVFALWKTTFPAKPILWRRSRFNYTCGVWNTFRPSIFRLTRTDGIVELWHLRFRSDRYLNTNFICGLGLTGTFTHPLPLKQNIIAFADANGALRLYYVTHHRSQVNERDVWSTYKICEREENRKKKFLKWQTDWLTKHAESIQAEKEREAALLKEKEERERLEKEKMEEELQRLRKAEEQRLALLQVPQPGQYEEWANRQWLAREKKRMNAVLLAKKSLQFDILEKQKAPLMKELKEEDAKRERLAVRLQNAPQLLKDTVAMMFPDVVEKSVKSRPDPYGGGEPLDERVKHFTDYQEVEDNCLKYVKTHQYVPRFEWLQILKAGKDRRKILDGGHTRNSHKMRLVREKNKLKTPKVGQPINYLNAQQSDSQSELEL